MLLTFPRKSYPHFLSKICFLQISDVTHHIRSYNLWNVCRSYYLVFFYFLYNLSKVEQLLLLDFDIVFCRHSSSSSSNGPSGSLHFGHAPQIPPLQFSDLYISITPRPVQRTFLELSTIRSGLMEPLRFYLAEYSSRFSNSALCSRLPSTIICPIIPFIRIQFQPSSQNERRVTNNVLHFRRRTLRSVHYVITADFSS